jgi:L-ascorbate metabolism protein UlaG (beta-lactamase superfamily)
MHDEHLYLRPNVKVEPLVDRWYAWSHLISPATACRNITERHLPIMDSYIANPQIHANAVKNPKMLGGPFIDYQGRRVDEIRDLKCATIRDRAHMVELSKAITILDEMLRLKAKGLSLHPLYCDIPEPLRGYVELVYDLNSNPSFRFIEPLLYKSRYNTRDGQSLMLSLIDGDDRPFMLSTPRLDDPTAFQLNKSFCDKDIDTLFMAKRSPLPWSKIEDILELDDSQQTTAQSFFTTLPAAPYEPYNGAGVRWRYFGHACILIEWQGLSLLCDPVLSYTYESDISRYTYDHLPDVIDYVLITHNHQDHVLFETLLQIRHRVKTFIVPRNGNGGLQDPSLKLTLKDIGCDNVIELSEMQCIDLEDGFIQSLPFFGEHSDLAISTKSAYLIRLGSHRLLFAADSCNIEPHLYEHLHNWVGDVDALFLGMECDGAPLSWLYGPLLTRKIERAMDESRRLSGSNYEQGMNIVKHFNCREVFVYAMGQEPWLNYVMSLKYTPESRPITESDRLIKDCIAQGKCAERLFGEKEILLP